MRKLRRLFKFFKRLWLYLPVIWNDRDYDYAAVLTLMKFKLGHLREHIADHQLFVGWEEVVKEIEEAEMLLDKYTEDDWSDDGMKAWDDLFDHVKLKMRGWWCVFLLFVMPS